MSFVHVQGSSYALIRMLEGPMMLQMTLCGRQTLFPNAVLMMPSANVSLIVACNLGGSLSQLRARLVHV